MPKQKRKIPISRYIKSQFIGKNKSVKVKVLLIYLSSLQSVNERPKTQEERQIYKYLCPICFKYYNEMLECVYCENYICMFCARDLIRTELKRTRSLVPLPPDNQLYITCPQCMKSSVTQIFRDVQKTKPLKYYTDSPMGGNTQVVLNFGMEEEELKISRRVVDKKEGLKIEVIKANAPNPE